ncbi:uroporphyrinogen-III C-methyltransferase [Pseudohalioglobus lutimaris]|uniref:Uroporphyrinogen III n=1 Tax=Pseudohalioglobus lutimaris TaxID=1737061 RepID=A0A2N5X1Y8_9GAMM|nr:uroporphyrinogen-III C-methyltransferase [Pseudohalioglobus lutimaris]PLW68501.1 uroporphyrinogen III [Pseudohalioglobus lutimaris]
MSEKNDKPSEESAVDAVQEPAGEKPGSEESAVSPATQPDSGPSRPPSPPPPAAAKKGGSSIVGWLALLLVLALGGAAGWTVMQGLEREKALQQRVVELESVTGSEGDELRALERKLQAEVNSGVQEARAELASQAEAMGSLRSQIERQGEQLAAYSANDHESWLRAEAQYLLRLASQRVIMARDTESALALLNSADAILRELDDSSLHAVRAAIAAEQAALRAVPSVDVEGIYLRLTALIEQAGELRIFQLQDQVAQPEAEPADEWQVRLERGYEEAARKLSDYIVIRRRDVPMQALMDPQWEGLVRQNLRMLLEQAQVALLSGNQTLYVESLQRAQHWVDQFLDTDEAAARAMAREITQLEGQIIQVNMPNMDRSLQALDEAMKRRLQQGGAE